MMIWVTPVCVLLSKEKHVTGRWYSIGHDNLHRVLFETKANTNSWLSDWENREFNSNRLRVPGVLFDLE